MCGAGVSRRSAFGRLIMAVKTTARIRVVNGGEDDGQDQGGENGGAVLERQAENELSRLRIANGSQIHRDLHMKDAGYKRAWSSCSGYKLLTRTGHRRTLRFSDNGGHPRRCVVQVVLPVVAARQPLISCRVGSVTSKLTGTSAGSDTTLCQTQIRKLHPEIPHACQACRRHPRCVFPH